MKEINHFKKLRSIIYSLLPALILLSFFLEKELIKSLFFLVFGIWACSFGCSFFNQAKTKKQSPKNLALYSVSFIYFILGIGALNALMAGTFFKNGI
jgi:hypothetical protein